MYLLHRIENHLRRHGIPPTRFGRLTVRDPRLVFDLRRGREMRPATIARVVEYMERQESQSA